MKKTFAVILLVMMMLSVVGCQQTPESSIVAGKNNNTLIEKAKGDVNEGETLAERIGAPETYQSSVSSEDGLLNVTIDAAVAVPEAENVPIIRVTPGGITQEQADILMEELVHADLYDPYHEQTKEQIMEQILENQRLLAEGPTEDDLSMSYYDEEKGELTWEEWMELAIDRLYEKYATAPGSQELEPISGQFVEDADGFFLIYGERTSEEFGYEGLQIYNHTNSLHDARALYIRDVGNTGFSMDYALAQNISDLVDLEDISDITITDNQARELCDALVEKLDIPGMACYSINKEYGGGSNDVPVRCCWVLQYTRDVSGMPITYTEAAGGAFSGDDVFQESWCYEKLTFLVNDNGIVGMTWGQPYELGEPVVEDAALLSFADAMDIFEKMYAVKMDGRELDVAVSDIRLGYTRILDQGELGNGLLVPVWDFFGVVTEKWGDEIDIRDWPEYSLLTINAIDGSIIDRDFGY